MLDVADALEANQNLIKVENEADISEAQQAGYEKPLIARLGLSAKKACTRFQYFNLCCLYVFWSFIWFLMRRCHLWISFFLAFCFCSLRSGYRCTICVCVCVYIYIFASNPNKVYFA